MISLREFAYEIRLRIDEGRASEAIPLAQYLLRRQPRYLRGYQLLAEAALEEGNITDAVEIFSRVLSADPESFAAHAGLASAFTDRNEMDNALWHMMRAFESEPGMKAVRDQLRYLYELRDGRAPGRLHLNPAALARSYLRSGSYDSAIDELVQELEHDPDRVDLRVTLAEAYWFAERHQDAAQMAYAVLEELPLAFKPHLILANFYYQAGEMEQAATHLRIAQELDPENEQAIALFGEGMAFRAIAIPIDEPDNIQRGTAPLGGTQLPEWLRDLSLFAAPEAPTDGMDWDAIIAYEDDWRTQLAAATREEFAAYKPNWRAGLRLATLRALRERGIAYPSPVAPEEIQAVYADSEIDWRDTLRAESDTVLASDASESSTPTLEVGGMPFTDSQIVAVPDWQGALRFSTDEAIAGFLPSSERETIELPDDRTIELPHLPLPATTSADWVGTLRTAMERTLHETPAPPPLLEPIAPAPTQLDAPAAPVQRLSGRWIPTLRVSTEIWVAMQRRGTRRETATLTPLEPEAPEIASIAEPARKESTPEWEMQAAPTVASDWSESDSATLESEPAADIEAIEAEETTAPGGSAVVDNEPLPEGDAPEEEAPYAEAVTVQDEEPIPAELTALEAARAAWQSGAVKEATAQYQMLFFEESASDAELNAAVREWTDVGSAPALIYQLLGDLNRRMGDMNAAVEYYREAINRM